MSVNHPAVLVGRDEPVAIAGDACQPRPFQSRQRDHRVGLDRPAARKLQPTGGEAPRSDGSLDPDPAVLEQPGHGLARRGAEQAERPVLGRGQHDLDPGRAALRQVGRGQERQLVDRQWPRDRGRSGEHDAPHCAGAGSVEQRGERRRVLDTAAVIAPGTASRGRAPSASSSAS